MVGEVQAKLTRPAPGRVTWSDRPAFPEYDRPGRFAATDVEADAEFLRRFRGRAEEQRRKARETGQ